MTLCLQGVLSTHSKNFINTVEIDIFEIQLLVLCFYIRFQRMTIKL
jgi:hypothetical protein